LFETFQANAIYCKIITVVVYIWANPGARAPLLKITAYTTKYIEIPPSIEGAGYPARIIRSFEIT
jgi:hypothetical protein